MNLFNGTHSFISGPPNICREQGVRSGLIPHPNNVQRYISCDFYQNRGCLTCSSTLWFNPIIKVCDYPEAVRKGKNDKPRM